MRFATPREGSIMIAYAVALHVVWGVALLADTHRIIPTALGDLASWLPQRAIAVTLLAVAVLAVSGVFVRTARGALALCGPQQVVMVFSGLSSSRAILSGHFADGVARPRAFILVDQLPVVLAALAHTWALYAMHRSRAA